MAKTIYDPEAKLIISEFIRDAVSNTSYLIPDLQRPYVWTPSQIIMLIDSLFRGWPFGSLLTWQVRPDYDEMGKQINQIPYRAFYTSVSRVRGVDSEEATVRPQPSPRDGDLMILDGQQRLQSLILALGNSKGLCLYDDEWKSDLGMASRGGKSNKNNYVRGRLFLDVNEFINQVDKNGGFVERIELSQALVWVACDENDFSKRRGGVPTEPVIPYLKTSKKCYALLSELWKLAALSATFGNAMDKLEEFVKRYLLEKSFTSEKLSELYEKCGGEQKVCNALAQFLCRLRDVGEVGVRCLKIKLFESAYKGLDEGLYTVDMNSYNDAIVNIFTRLNTAGRQLTREEITYAWLKRGWEGNDGFPTAPEFVEAVRNKFERWGFEDDLVIRYLAHAWSVHENDGHVIRERELLDGNTIKPMTKFISSNVNVILQATEELVGDINTKGYPEIIDAPNAVLVAWVYYIVMEMALQNWRNRGRRSPADENEKNQIMCLVRAKFLPRWLVIPTWAGRWRSSTADFFSQLFGLMANTYKTLNASDYNLNVVAESMEELGKKMCGIVKETAKEQIDINVTDRNRVSAYRSRLIVWQRLTENRSNYRKLTFKSPTAKSIELQVDHVVPYAGWEDFIQEKINSNELTLDSAIEIFMESSSDEEKALFRQQQLGKDVKEVVKKLAMQFINHMGNCSILVQAYNKYKDKKELGDFLDAMSEFKVVKGAEVPEVDRNQWCSDMKLSDEFVHPFTGGHSVKDIVSAIRRRGAIICSELKGFIDEDPSMNKIY